MTDIPDLYDNYGLCATTLIQVTKTPAPFVPVTCIYVPIEGVTKGDHIDVRASIVLNVYPQLQPVVTSCIVWLNPSITVPGWNPTAVNPALRGSWWGGQDINYIPAAGSGKYLRYDPHGTFRWPFDTATNVVAIASVYAASDVHAGSISLFPSQTMIRATRVGPGWQGGVWRGVVDATMALHSI